MPFPRALSLSHRAELSAAPPLPVRSCSRHEAFPQLLCSGLSKPRDLSRPSHTLSSRPFPIFTELPWMLSNRDKPRLARWQCWAWCTPGFGRPFGCQGTGSAAQTSVGVSNGVTPQLAPSSPTTQSLSLAVAYFPHCTEAATKRLSVSVRWQPAFSLDSSKDRNYAAERQAHSPAVCKSCMHLSDRIIHHLEYVNQSGPLYSRAGR